MPSWLKKILIAAIVVLALGFIVYRSSGFIHLADFSGAKLLHAIRGANPFLLILSLLAIHVGYAIRSLRWRVFQKNIGPSSFKNIYQLTVAGFAAIFLLGRAGEPVRPLLLARKEKLPVADMFGIYVLERIFDTASTAVIASIGLFVFESHAHSGETARHLETAARTTGTILFAGVLSAVGLLVYLRLHGTALLERRFQNWRTAQGWRSRFAGTMLGFVRGVQTIRSWEDLALATLLSAAHWFLIAVIYLWISHAFGGSLARLTLGGALLVMAFTLVGSAVQLPGVGGGSQVASFLAYTTVFGVENEAAAAAAIVLWLITFAACSLFGTPLLIREGWSLGELKKLAQEEKELEEGGGTVA
ncbi:MAG: hypothetical protein NVS9B4_11220 [Candidatus Acidiferrum sp.]